MLRFRVLGDLIRTAFIYIGQFNVGDNLKFDRPVATLDSELRHFFRLVAMLIRGLLHNSAADFYNEK